MRSLNLTATAWSTPNIYADKFDGVLKTTFKVQIAPLGQDFDDLFFEYTLFLI